MILSFSPISGYNEYGNKIKYYAKEELFKEISIKDSIYWIPNKRILLSEIADEFPEYRVFNSFLSNELVVTQISLTHKIIVVGG